MILSFTILGIAMCLFVGPQSVSSRIPNSNRITSPPPKVPWPIVVPVPELRAARQFFGVTQNYTTSYPEWANKTLITEGQKFLRDHFYGFQYSSGMTTFLMGVDIQRVLIAGGNTTEVSKATKRYLVNVLNFYHWATAPLDSEELYESINLVHAIHAKVGHEAHRQQKMFSKPLIPEPLPGRNPMNIQTPIWQAFERDLLASPLRRFRKKELFPPRDGQTVYPLNMFAMATQLWGFIGHALISPEKFLMSGVTDDQLWAYLHFWAFMGRALGIEDKYNVCLQPDLATAQKYFKDILYEYYVPPLLDMTYEHKVVLEIAITAMGRILGAENLGLGLYRVCLDSLGIQCPNLHSVMGPMGRMANYGMENLAKRATTSRFGKGAVNFMVNGLVQVHTLKHFKLNTLYQKNFSEGLIELDREILRTSDVHWTLNDTEALQRL